MNDKQTAAEILEKIGGKENVTHLEHCSTRLRFTLRDYGKVDVTALKNVPGVLGVVMTGQCQVVIGNNVIEVYDKLYEFGPFGGEEAGTAPAKKGQRPGFGAWLIDFIVGVFQPLIPAIAGAGILKSLLLLVDLFGWIDAGGPIYAAFMAIADAAFYFLPLLVAMSTATKLGCNRYVAVSVVGCLLLPSLTGLIAADGGLRLFGLTVQNISYAYQVFPALLAVLFLAPLERFLNRYTPKPIRVFFVPLVSILITVPVTLLLLAPLGFNVGRWFTTAILFLFDRLGFVAVTLLAVVLPFIIATGMHKALVPYAVSSIGELGRELLYLPASLAHNIAESGASFAAAVRTRDRNVRSTGISAGISAAFGITEPALYGLTMQNKRTLYSVLIGSAAGALYIGWTGVESYVAVGPGLASLTMFVSADMPRNIINAAIGAVIAFGASFLSGIFLYRDIRVETTAGVRVAGESHVEKKAQKVGGEADRSGVRPTEQHVADVAEPSEGEETAQKLPLKADKRMPEEGSEEVPAETELLFAPMDGTLIPLSQVKDEVFSGCVLGDGVAVLPRTGEVHAPVDGIIESVFDTGHAITILSAKGAEILIHVGLDTVKLNGKYYEALVKKGQQVKKGQLLMRFDLEKIREAGYDTVTPIVIGNSARFILTPEDRGEIQRGDPILSLSSEEKDH